MNIKWHTIVQIVATFIQGINIADITGYVSFLPPKYAAVVLFVVSTGQAALGLWNHYFHPDGSKLG